jgi:peptidyl-prolyl cis-trans isomerase C
MSLLGRWLKEPLLHFVVLGAALFALYHAVAPQGRSKRIVLPASAIRGLRQDYLRRTGALPTAAEETALIQRFIDDEVLYREALALGLDRGDIITRRRLVQKMEFLTEGMEPIPEPSDAELQDYLDLHMDRYAVPERVALIHVFARNDGHSEAVSARAAELRAQLLAGADPSSLGDPFLRGREFRLSTERQLAGIFGDACAVRIMSLPEGSWSEPIRSSYGLHLVRVTAHQPAQRPALAEVRTALRRDWEEQQRADAKRTELARLREHYDIRIEGAEASAFAAAPAAAMGNGD